MTNKKYTQVMRYSEDELNIIKDNFLENWELLNALRKKFLQMPMSTLDLSVLEINKKPEVNKLLRKHFLPELSDDVPFALQSDFLLAGNLKELVPEIAVLHLKALKQVADYIRDILDNKPSRLIKGLESLDNKTDKDIYVDMLSRNTIISHIETKLNELKVLAGKKEETPEDTAKRLRKNSGK